MTKKQLKAEDLVEGASCMHTATRALVTVAYMITEKSVAVDFLGGRDRCVVSVASLSPIPKKSSKILDTNDLNTFCNEILELSINWTGEDEEKIPALKTIRTLAGYYFNKDKEND